MTKYRFAEVRDPDAEAFEAWMELVDEALLLSVGVGVEDLEDAPYHDYFDEGVDPSYAAEMVMSYIRECIY